MKVKTRLSIVDDEWINFFEREFNVRGRDALAGKFIERSAKLGIDVDELISELIMKAHELKHGDDRRGDVNGVSDDPTIRRLSKQIIKALDADDGSERSQLKIVDLIERLQDAGLDLEDMSAIDDRLDDYVDMLS